MFFSGQGHGWQSCGEVITGKDDTMCKYCISWNTWKVIKMMSDQGCRLKHLLWFNIIEFTDIYSFIIKTACFCDYLSACSACKTYVNLCSYSISFLQYLLFVSFCFGALWLWLILFIKILHILLYLSSYIWNRTLQFYLRKITSFLFLILPKKFFKNNFC